MFCVKKIREDFPILKRKVNRQDLIYFDNAATTQKPLCVIDCIDSFYKEESSNVHRGVHTLSQEATNRFELSRKTVQEYINAKHSHEVIFTKGTTESINLVASCITGQIKKGDEIIISHLEHHSNIVPWQMLCDRTGAILRVIPIEDSGELIFCEYEKLLSEKTSIIAISHASNTLGVINDIKKIIDKARQYDAKVLIDGAQYVAHLPVDVQDLDVDFYVFSAHKMYGTSGVGVLYGREEILDKLPPYQGGGNMIKEVSFEKTTYDCLANKFEAGTPNIEGVVAFEKAINYISGIGLENISKYEDELLYYATEKLQSISGLKIYGRAVEKIGVISFNVDKIHHYDLGLILDKMGIAIRTGHHCTQPIMKRFDISGTARLSLAMYNTKEEIDKMSEALVRAIKILS
ncbi:aminotransferase class V-fold PLP-dependent enzyme [Ichthyobacterium seriolicida]|uniref:Cysteine desulfurase n=1 Tax=Ichthyobacterium seriolicida TaxID=242600 RepID=A0A1J1DXL6_9FLAO|nr:cysteine desulfurase [Ichthyobacterium seriolicida]BAV94602.1 cysteine desulfurase [Ichthyobacterium seriolicida]